jgi:hypothetical protein
MRTYVLRQGMRVQTASDHSNASTWAIGNAVLETSDGAWLATWDCQTLEPLLDTANLQIPAPEGWREVIAYEMFDHQGAR